MLCQEDYILGWERKMKNTKLSDPGAFLYEVPQKLRNIYFLRWDEEKRPWLLFVRILH